jgi:quinol-cytochrome oxidoreductase complex cytochrome b subunit
LYLAGDLETARKLARRNIDAFEQFLTTNMSATIIINAAGCGALLGALYLAGRRSMVGLAQLIPAAGVVFGLGLMAFAYSRVLWLSIGLMVVTGFMGYVLPWGQMSFWAATVITNLFSAIPLVGDPIVTWLWGGYAVGNPTLNRFYSLHYLLPFVIVGVVVLHVWALHMVGQNNPAGIEPKTERDTVAFTPYATIKDGFFLLVFCILFAWFVFYIPNFLGHPDNYIPANPAVTPTHIVPEWYYLPFYAILRAIPNKLLGVMALGASIVILAFLPWLDTSKVRSMRYRPTARLYYLIFFLTCLVLGYCGAHAPDDKVIPGGSGFQLLDADLNSIVWLSRFAALYYFAYFWVITPILGLTETPLPAPDTSVRLAPARRGRWSEATDRHPRRSRRPFPVAVARRPLARAAFSRNDPHRGNAPRSP